MSASSEHIVDLARSFTGDALAEESRRENPDVVETLGRAFAEALRSHRVDAVVLWSDPHTAVLGHVVARELRSDLIYAYADEGILTLTATPTSGTQVVVVDFEWEFQPGLVPLLTMLRRTSTVSAIASVLPLPIPLREDEIANAALVTLSAPESGIK